jgi:hypothetical protein
MAVIYSKTAAGQTALQSRSVPLTPRQRSVFIMFDGKRSSEEILRLTSGLGATQADIDLLVEHGLLELTGLISKSAARPVASLPVTAPSSSISANTKDDAPGVAASREDTQAIYLKAYPVATRLVSALGFRGFTLNLAVEAAGNLQELRELAPKIRKAVGDEKFRELEDALR